MKKLMVQCTNCFKEYELDLEARYVDDICPKCGSIGVIKYRIPGKHENEEANQDGFTGMNGSGALVRH